MNFRNLKLHTALNIFFILTIGMLMINGVVAVFWHEHMIKQQLNYLQTQLQQDLPLINTKLVYSKDINLTGLDSIKPIDFHVTKLIFNQFYITFKNGKAHQVNRSNSTYTVDAIHKRLKGNNTPSLLFFRKYRHTIFYNSTLFGTHTIPIGIEIDTSDFAQQIWKKEKIILLYIFFNACFLTTIIFFRFRRLLFVPIDRLLTTANNYQLKDGLWSSQALHDGEFSQLSQVMNTMVQRIEKDRDKLIEHVKQLENVNIELQRAQQETIQAEKLASTGILAAGFAHEIGNPLTIIQGYIELLQNGSYSEPEKMDFLNRSISEIKRIDKLLFQLMNLPNSKQQGKTKVCVSKIFEDVISTLQTAFIQNNISVLMNEIDRSQFITADPEQLRQIFINILLNAIDAIVEKSGIDEGEIKCLINCSFRKNKEFVQIKITDNGVGFTPQISDLVFDPFFTTKPVGKGTGLGLTVVHRIIDSLGGHIDITSKLQDGTTFSIYIPQYVEDHLDD